MLSVGTGLESTVRVYTRTTLTNQLNQTYEGAPRSTFGAMTLSLSDSQHKRQSETTLSLTMLFHYSECHVLFTITLCPILFTIMLNVIMLSV